MDMTLDASGGLRVPNPHDAEIVGLALHDDNGQRELRITLRPEKPANRRFALVLAGLERLRCMDFREGNIVLSVDIVRNRRPYAEALHILLDSAVKPSPASIDRFAREVAVGRLTLVQISPSYGCELVALCREVRAEEGTPAR